MKKILTLTLALLFAAVPVAFAADTLRENISAATGKASADADETDYRSYVVDGQKFMLRQGGLSSTADADVYDLEYRIVEDGIPNIYGDALHIRFYKGMKELKGNWMTDENSVELVSKGVYNPATDAGEDKEMFYAIIAPSAVSADRKILTNTGVVQVYYVHFVKDAAERERIKEMGKAEKKQVLMNMIGVVSKVEVPAEYEIIRLAREKKPLK